MSALSSSSRSSCPRGSRESLFPPSFSFSSTFLPYTILLNTRSSSIVHQLEGLMAAYGQDTFFKATVCIRLYPLIHNTSPDPCFYSCSPWAQRSSSYHSSVILISDTGIEIIRSWSPSLSLTGLSSGGGSVYMVVTRFPLKAWSTNLFACERQWKVREARVGILLPFLIFDPWAKTGQVGHTSRKEGESPDPFTCHVLNFSCIPSSFIFLFSFLFLFLTDVWNGSSFSSIPFRLSFFFTLHRYNDCCWCFERNTFPFLLFIVPFLPSSPFLFTHQGSDTCFSFQEEWTQFKSKG